MIKYTLILFLSVGWSKFHAQSEEDILPPSNINGIQLFNPTTQNQSPFIGPGEYFILSFDDLSSSYERYNYFIKHYDKDWQESALFTNEFLDGYMNDNIGDFTSSFNTIQNYVHYELQFPNERMSPKVSGNYRLFVYTTDKNKPLFSVRFSVFENVVTLNMQQEVFDTSVNNNNHRISVIAQADPSVDLNRNVRFASLTLLKNNNWYNTISDIPPQFVFTNRFEFKQMDLTFDGGNEYYYFDTKNKEINGFTTAKVGLDQLYYAQLYPNLAFPEIYDFNPDVNGAFYIRRNDRGIEREAATDADYVQVYFQLNSSELKGKKVYVVGAFNRYELSNGNEMVFNERGFYYKTILLKQGYYNYKYVVVNDKGMRDDKINGNFWQTENLYTGLLYYRDLNRNYDRLLGLGEVSSQE